ncbi:MAG: hypothetical protein ACOX69_06880 [Coriobacteriales bacterium]
MTEKINDSSTGIAIVVVIAVVIAGVIVLYWCLPGLLGIPTGNYKWNIVRGPSGAISLLAILEKSLA